MSTTTFLAIFEFTTGTVSLLERPLAAITAVSCKLWKFSVAHRLHNLIVCEIFLLVSANRRRYLAYELVYELFIVNTVYLAVFRLINTASFLWQLIIAWLVNWVVYFHTKRHVFLELCVFICHLLRCKQELLFPLVGCGWTWNLTLLLGLWFQGTRIVVQFFLFLNHFVQLGLIICFSVVEGLLLEHYFSSTVVYIDDVNLLFVINGKLLLLLLNLLGWMCFINYCFRSCYIVSHHSILVLVRRCCLVSPTIRWDTTTFNTLLDEGR